MANITTGTTFKCTAKHVQAARLMAEGKTLDEIALICWDVTDGAGHLDERKKRNALKTLRLWKKKPEFTELYRALLREMAMPAYGKALNRITQQIDDPNPWIAQGAAREALTRFGPAIMGENENEIVIKVEGMPVLGMPGQPTTDGSEE